MSEAASATNACIESYEASGARSLESSRCSSTVSAAKPSHPRGIKCRVRTLHARAGSTAMAAPAAVRISFDLRLRSAPACRSHSLTASSDVVAFTTQRWVCWEPVTPWTLRVQRLHESRYQIAGRVVFMESAPFSGLLDPSVGVGCGTAGSVCVGRVDEKELSDEALRSHLKVLGRAESRLAAMKSRSLAELSRRHSTADAQRLVRDELQASKREAKRDVETATRLAELPATSEALESGEIPKGHARLIARASGESPIDEALLVKAANGEPFDEFAQTVKRHQQDVADDDGQALLDRQRAKRKARIFESSDSGMFVLTGEFDQITGARIATALTAKERQLWHREDPSNRATPQQRMSDALAELICQLIQPAQNPG